MYLDLADYLTPLFEYPSYHLDGFIPINKDEIVDNNRDLIVELLKGDYKDYAEELVGDVDCNKKRDSI